ncbi:hypothetical protein ACFV2H_19880 [Streptomyces sp. NPDC059629]|uniref:hypothetical protein n=1 Tax=Streptomyces sp. NPDC059629 TaxID=3346889 RepID=UPI00367BF4EB
MASSSARTHTLHARTSALLRRAVPAATCLLALTACGAGGAAHSTAGVASLPSSPGKTGSQASSAPAETSASGRPQQRMDDTEERRAQLIYAWNSCLVDHGAHWNDARAAAAGIAPGGKSAVVADPVPEAAKKACMNKLPVGPPEENPNLNPHYADDMKADVACLRAHGYQVHLTKDTSDDPKGLGWTYDDGATGPAANATVEHTCEMQAFAGKKG